jgi:H+-translocating NAD(P) transhydrogenase subunit alpha
MIGNDRREREPMIVGVPKETIPGERRVALVPGVLPSLTGKGFEVLIEAGAGVAAGFPDEQYEAKGARIVASRAELIAAAEIVAQVRGATEGWREGQVAIGFYDPLSEPASVGQLASTGAIGFSMELMPRITRAQSMDALSSMATIAGYKAVILAAEYLPRLFPMLMTAAGTLAPAKVFVVGVGVAGLQAIATAKRLGGRGERV